MKYLFFIPLLIWAGCASQKLTTENKTTAKQLIKDIKILSDDKFEGRKTGTHGNQLAQAYIINRLKQIGISPSPYTKNFLQSFEISSKNGSTKTLGQNILGYIKGKSDNVMVISAHYDHIGIQNGEIYNGADDNASGVAALLQFAQYFKQKQPNYTLILAFFDGEEMGLQGAKHFVKHPTIPFETIKLNINMDMIAHNHKGELYVAGSYKYPNLKPYLVANNPNLKLLLGHDDPKLGHDDWTNQSDQGAFNEKNIPFLYFGVEDHKDYHKPTDEFKSINQQFFKDAANVIQSIIVKIDNEQDFQKIFSGKLIMK